jgi:adenylate cyclase
MKGLIKAAGIVLIVTVLYLLVDFSGTMPFFDFRLYDMMANLRRETVAPESSATVVVEIDEQSLKELGQWPWPRIVLAKILQEILIQKPAVVGFDILFPEADRTSPTQLKKFYRQNLGIDIRIKDIPSGLKDYDLVFANVLASGPTILPLFVTRKDRSAYNGSPTLTGLLPLPANMKIPIAKQVICNIPALQRAVKETGFINASVDSDGILRREPLFVRYQGQGLPCLALAMLARVDPDITIRSQYGNWSPFEVVFAGKAVLANRRGEILNPLYPKNSFKRVSASKLLTGKIPAGFFTGKMVLVGASATGLFDRYVTSSGKILPGVFVHASLLENLFSGRGLYQLEIYKKIALFISFLFSILVIVLIVRRFYLLAWVFYFSVSLLSIVFAWVMFKRGVVVSIGYFLTPFSCLLFVVSMFFALFHYIERKRFLEDLSDAHSATIDSMTTVAESRDLETGGHIIRTKEYVVILARALRNLGHYRKELTPRIIELLYRAAPLHDIGKVGISDAILRKPGKLTDEEYRIMKTHVDIGKSIIENAINSYRKTNDFLTIAANIAYSHHERWDGNGYPLGLSGTDIPLEGRLMSVADVFDALISPRYYKSTIPFPEAEQIIVDWSGKYFDPLIVQAFIFCRDDLREVVARNTASEPPQEAKIHMNDLE